VDRQSLSLRADAGMLATREAGELALEFYRKRHLLAIERKGRQDLVSEADRACESLIADSLSRAFPDDSVLGEEGGFTRRGEATWVIDPIDGTSNFLTGVNFWCVSVALVLRSEPLLGFVYDPVADEMFSAVRSEGAFLNNRPIQVSGETDMTRARVCLGFSFRRPAAAHAQDVATLLDAGCEYLRLGSGALGTAYVGAGRFDGYWERHINVWDIAAALAIAREAGATTNDFLAGDGFEKGNEILAATPALYNLLKELFDRG
jgi:myo-inositol-1(or 4)-monophosphatase